MYFGHLRVSVFVKAPLVLVIFPFSGLGRAINLGNGGLGRAINRGSGGLGRVINLGSGDPLRLCSSKT